MIDLETETLQVSEIFYSLQGEGRRAGEPSVFIRLRGCSAKHACYAAGVRCDTEYESGSTWKVAELIAHVKKLSSCRFLIFTGGEPLDQLSADVVLAFKLAGFDVGLETSGAKPIDKRLHNLINWLVVSPKVAEHVLAKHFPDGVHELRYVRHAGQSIPEPQVTAIYHCLSPHNDGNVLNVENVRHCVALCLANPRWRLSVQMHKLWGVL